jgi:hypothetical protein
MATVAGRSTTATCAGRVTAAEDAKRHGHNDSDQPLHRNLPIVGNLGLSGAAGDT